MDNFQKKNKICCMIIKENRVPQKNEISNLASNSKNIAFNARFSF